MLVRTPKLFRVHSHHKLYVGLYPLHCERATNIYSFFLPGCIIYRNDPWHYVDSQVTLLRICDFEQMPATRFLRERCLLEGVC